MQEFERPEFAVKIIEKYKSAQSNTFIVYGNIRDIYAVTSDRYVPLIDFFLEALIKPDKPTTPRIVIMYDPVTGVSIPNPQDKIAVSRILGQARYEKMIQTSRSDIGAACEILRELLRLNIMVSHLGDPVQRIRKGFAVVISHGEAAAPAGESVSDADRLKVMVLENWFSDANFVASEDIVFVISETLSGISPRITNLPYCSAIRIDRPKFEERRNYIEYLIRNEGLKPSVGPDHLAFSSAGLTLLSIKQIFQHATYKEQEITPELIFEKSKEIIEKELEGYVEFPKLTYGFEKVIGAKKLITRLNELKKCIQGDDPDLMPVGILVPGANGVGKTFIFKAFAKECGWIGLILKNIRGSYVGETERNWEKIRSVLEAMGAVMVLYDEADTEIGGRGAHTHDVDRRLFGNILKMMSDPGNRGKIIWIVITARPDRLEPDIKRSGRAGEHLPVFAYEGPEKDEFIDHVMREAGVDFTEFSPAELTRFKELTKDYFPADFDQLITELKRREMVDGPLTPDKVLDEALDFIPADIARQREYQELLAAVECTSRELLPPRFAELTKEDMQMRLLEIRSTMVLQ
jgi:hypothetical protein